MIDRHTLEKLQFDHVRGAVADCCACTLGKALALRLEPSFSVEMVRRWFEQIRQMEAAWYEPGPPPLGGVRDIRPQLQDAATPAGLDGHDLLRVAETLSATAAICQWTENLPDELGLIKTLGGRVGNLGAVAAQIDRAVDQRGKVRDDASPRLADLRRAIDSARAEVDQVFSRILREARVLRMLQYPSATFHDDRRVLPLKENYRGQIKGIIHRSSDSGATLFVEPAEAVQLNNAIVSLKEEEHREEGRILGKLSFLVHQNAPAIEKSLEAIAVLDLVTGKLRYLHSRKATCPEVREDMVLELHDARHPILLDLQMQAEPGSANEVVPINVRLGEDFDLLMITGPNTGGKTVTLKTVGLLALTAQCGVPIPVGPGSRIPIYRRIFIDVGDEQSIEQSLSTFSSHLSNVLHVLSHADSHSLVLLDELGAGTDPDEGAAIGRAIIDELLRARCQGVITTHLSALKAVAFTADRVDNASVEFDPETLRPTYRLRIGEPGNSNALIVAQRLGMPKRMIHTARGYLSHRDRTLHNAIAGTLESRRQAERARLSAHQALLDAEQQRIHYERELRTLKHERQTKLEWYAWLDRLVPGDEVFVSSFQRTAKVVRMQLQRQTAVVTAGHLEMEVGINELSQPPAEEPG